MSNHSTQLPSSRHDRLLAEKEALNRKEFQQYQAEFNANETLMKFVLPYEQSRLLCELNISQFPNVQPTVKILPDVNYIFLTDLDEHVCIEYRIHRMWNSDMALHEIIGELQKTLREHIISKKHIPKTLVGFKFLNSIYAKAPTDFLRIIFVIATIVRLIFATCHYSGEQHEHTEHTVRKGEFDLQRGWMALTYNLPPEKWYLPFRDHIRPLDYPPLYGYITYLFAYLGHFFEPGALFLVNVVYSTPSFKAFMRATVLLVDIVIFYTGAWVIVNQQFGKLSKILRYPLLLSILIMPLFVTVDHGHFQYNCIVHGTLLWASYFYLAGHNTCGFLLFFCALHIHQMVVFTFLPFIFYTIGYIYRHHQSMKSTVLPIFKLLGGALTLLIAIWLPFLQKSNIWTILSSLSPFHGSSIRYHEAPNLWGILDTYLKVRTFYPALGISAAATLFTIAGCGPSIWALLKNPKPKYLKLALFNCSMSFYLFSNGISERGIMIPLLFYWLNFNHFSHYLSMASLLSVTSLFVMTRADDYFIINTLANYACFAFLDPFFTFLEAFITKPKTSDDKFSHQFRHFWDSGVKWLLFGCVAAADIAYVVSYQKAYEAVFYGFYAVPAFLFFVAIFVQSNFVILTSLKKDKGQKADKYD